MEGRNFDYGHQKSDSKEGQMARRALLTMAKDLYNLYMTLNDHDDLPEWCHYKLATSRKDLSDITDYLTSKVMKMCIDKNMSTEDLRLEINNSISGSILEEGFFDIFKKKNKKTKPKSPKPKVHKVSNVTAGALLHSDSDRIQSIKDPTLKVLMILKKLSAIYEMYIEPYYSEYLANKDIGDNYGENRIAMQKSLADAISKSEDYGLQMFLKAALVIKSASAKSGSARKVPQTKKKSFKNLFGLIENTSVDMTLKGLTEVQFLTVGFQKDIAIFLSKLFKEQKDIDMTEVYRLYKKSEIDREIKKIARNISKLHSVVQSFANSSISFNDDTVDDMMVNDETHPATQKIIDQGLQRRPTTSSAKKKYNPYT